MYIFGFLFFSHFHSHSHWNAVAVVVIEVWLIVCHFFTWQTEKYAQKYQTSSIYSSMSLPLSFSLICYWRIATYCVAMCTLSIRLHLVALQSDIRPAFTLYICSTQLICIFPFHIHHLNDTMPNFIRTKQQTLQLSFSAHIIQQLNFVHTFAQCVHRSKMFASFLSNLFFSLRVVAAVERKAYCKTIPI